MAGGRGSPPSLRPWLGSHAPRLAPPATGLHRFSVATHAVIVYVCFRLSSLAPGKIICSPTPTAPHDSPNSPLACLHSLQEFCSRPLACGACWTSTARTRTHASACSACTACTACRVFASLPALTSFLPPRTPTCYSCVVSRLRYPPLAPCSSLTLFVCGVLCVEKM